MNPTEPTPRIVIVATSLEEAEQARPAIEALESLGLSPETKIASGLAAPDAAMEWARLVESEGTVALVVAAGREPALPGLLAAACRLPVIVMPTATDRADADPLAALACLGEPDAPIGLVAAASARQAALFAARVAALVDPRLRESLNAAARQAEQDLDEQDALWNGERRGARIVTPVPSPPARLEAVHARAAAPTIPAPPMTSAVPAPPAAPTATPSSDDPPRNADNPAETARVRRAAEMDRPLDGQPVTAAAQGSPDGEPVAKSRPAPMPARSLGRLRIDMDSPDVAAIEEVVDCLLEGGVIAFPTETVYGLAVDATNQAAVERLFAFKGRDRGKAITLMVDSSKLLAAIAQNVTTEIRRLMEAFWPGALTLIFQKRPGNFRHVSPGETIGVRLPDHSVPLAIMQALARPLACTSANLAGQPDARSADEIEAFFGDRLNALLDGGTLPQRPASTVVDVSREPFRVLRQGAITREQIGAVVGALLDPEA
jgi:L-threonylcarbamoyladenylate synthase